MTVIAFLLGLTSMLVPFGAARLLPRATTRGSRVGAGALMAIAMVAIFGVGVSLSASAIGGAVVGLLIWGMLAVRSVSTASRGRVGRPISKEEADRLVQGAHPAEVEALMAKERMRRDPPAP